MKCSSSEGSTSGVGKQVSFLCLDLVKGLDLLLHCEVQAPPPQRTGRGQG